MNRLLLDAFELVLDGTGAVEILNPDGFYPEAKQFALAGDERLEGRLDLLAELRRLKVLGSERGSL